MTAKEIERKMEQYTGAEFITPGKLTSFLGRKDVSRVKDRFLRDLPTIGGTKAYFIPDVAKNVFRASTWEE